MRLRMLLLILMSFKMASSTCMNDKGMDIYNKYMNQCQNKPIGGSDLASYMASPVSQNILRPDGVSANSSMLVPPITPSSQAMYSTLGMAPNIQSSTLLPTMTQPLGYNYGYQPDEQQQRDLMNSQIQNIKNQVLTCKSIYGEDSPQCCINGGSSKDLNALNMTTRTGIPCLDAMTYTGLGPATDILQNALYTSNRSGGFNQNWPVYGKGNMQTNCNGSGGNQFYNTMNANGYYPSTQSNGNSMLGNSNGHMGPGNGMQQTNGMCKSVPSSFCNMMNGPILGQSASKKCAYKGDIISLNEHCKKFKCNDGCPIQTDCRNSISGPSMSPMTSYLTSQQPFMPYSPQMYRNNNQQSAQSCNPGYNYPTSFGQQPMQYQQPMPYQQQMQYQQPMPYQQPMQYQQPMPYQHVNYNRNRRFNDDGWHHYDDSSSNNRRYKGRNSKNRKYRNNYNNHNPNGLDGIILIEPNTELHDYVKGVISDPSRVEHVGDKNAKRKYRNRNGSYLVDDSGDKNKDNPKDGNSSTKTSSKNGTVKGKNTKKVPPVSRKKAKASKPKKSKTSKSEPSTTDNSEQPSETQNVFQDTPSEGSKDQKNNKRYVNEKERCELMAKKQQAKEENKRKIEEEASKLADDSSEKNQKQRKNAKKKDDTSNEKEVSSDRGPEKSSND